MNILFVSGDNNKYSGAFLSMVKLVSLLKSRYGHRILVLLPKKGNGQELLDEEGIEYIRITSFLRSVPIRQNAKWYSTIEGAGRTLVTKLHVPACEKLIRERNIDLVHINVSDSFIGAYAAIKTNTPFIWHIREFLEEDHERALYRKEKAYKVMCKAAKAVAISESIYNKYAEILDKNRISVIYNGIDGSKYLDESHVLFKNNITQFLMVGNLSEGKGQIQAIKACIKLHERNKNICLKLVGGDPLNYESTLKNIVREAGAEEYIIFCGTQDDTLSFYKEADIFLMCSRSEAFGRVTVEAMLAGCFVIGADSGGTKNLIADDKTGFLYESGNTEDLYEKLSYALESRDEAQTMAKRGQQFMLANMTADINAERINQLYAEILEGGAKRSKIIILSGVHGFSNYWRACA